MVGSLGRKDIVKYTFLNS
jgi:hypothetical protein